MGIGCIKASKHEEHVDQTIACNKVFLKTPNDNQFIIPENSIGNDNFNTGTESIVLPKASKQAGITIASTSFVAIPSSKNPDAGKFVYFID